LISEAGDGEIEQENDKILGLIWLTNHLHYISCNIISVRQKKQELIETDDWSSIAKSGNVELVWNVVQDWILEYSVMEYGSLDIRSMD
jgi:hypothetical protein